MTFAFAREIVKTSTRTNHRHGGSADPLVPHGAAGLDIEKTALPAFATLPTLAGACRERF